MADNGLSVSEVLSDSEGFWRSAEGSKPDARLLYEVAGIKIPFLLIPFAHTL